MDAGILTALVDHSTAAVHAKDLELREQHRALSAQLLLLLRHLLLGPHNTAQLHDFQRTLEAEVLGHQQQRQRLVDGTEDPYAVLDRLAAQANTLRSENEKLKHQFVAQRAAYESKLDALRKTNKTLKDRNEDLTRKLQAQHQQRLARLQASPASQHKSYIPRRQSVALTASKGDPAESQRLPVRLVADFSTTPYLKRYNRPLSPGRTGTPRSPSPTRRPRASYMSPTANSRNKLLAKGTVSQANAAGTPSGPLLATSTPQSEKSKRHDTTLKGTLTTRTTLASPRKAIASSDTAPKLAQILKRKKRQSGGGPTSARSSLTGELRDLIFDDRDRYDTEDRLVESNVRRMSSKAAAAPLRGKRRLGGKLLSETGLDENDNESEADFFEKRAKTAKGEGFQARTVAKVTLIDKLGGISPLKTGKKNLFNV